MFGSEQFSVKEWLEWSSSGGGGPWLPDEMVAALQRYYDECLKLWDEAGRPELPMINRENQASADDMARWPLAQWLTINCPAKTSWYEEQHRLAADLSYAVYMEEGLEVMKTKVLDSSFWEYAHVFNTTLNAMWHWA